MGKASLIILSLKKVQDLNSKQSKLQLHDTVKKDEKTTTNFETTDDIDVLNQGYLNEKIIKINGHLSL